MRFLFDTHTFLWFHGARAKLSTEVLELCEDPTHTIFLSLVSLWEIQIKHQVGKLELTMPLKDLIEKQQAENDIQFLPIALSHILALDRLPLYHKDPFDRLLIAQAQIENLILLSRDTELKQYLITVVW
jgi:PIN domain nuclease of toxin-antitoxin system